MKRVLLMICSLLLVCACVFGLFACVAGVKDILAIKEYKLADSAMAEEGIATARDGIAQLKENEATYIDGCVQYMDGKQLIADNTQAYNEGKETLATIEPLMPYIDTYQELRNGTIAKIPGFDTAQAWFAAIVKPVGAQLGLELPDDVTDLPAYIDTMVADGKAQLKQYEDGQVQLVEADGLLSQFEDGEKQLAAGMVQLQDSMTAGVTRSGKQVTPSLTEMLGEDFDFYQRDDNGNIKKSARGLELLDLDKCIEECDAATEYLAISGDDTEGELYGRLAAFGMAAVAAILGIIAGIFGIVAAITGGVKTGKTLGIISALLAVGANVVGIIIGYNDYAYQLRNLVDQATATPEELANIEYTYCGDLQYKALIILAIAAVLFVIFASIAKKAAKKKKVQPVAQANVVAAADADRVSALEAENAELKAMVSSLAEDAATVKE